LGWIKLGGVIPVARFSGKDGDEWLKILALPVLSMHYQNISSFGFLSLARKRASLVLPFNKVMDKFFFYLWLLI
jgi:hypothetical protein